MACPFALDQSAVAEGIEKELAERVRNYFLQRSITLLQCMLLQKIDPFLS